MLFQKMISQWVLRFFQRFQNRATRLVGDPVKMETALEIGLKKPKTLRGPLKKIRRDLILLYEILRDWFRGEYRAIPTGSIIAIIGSLLYFFSPFDAIPDFIPLAGLVDDAFILGLTINQIRADLNKYEIWKNSSLTNPTLGDASR